MHWLPDWTALDFLGQHEHAESFHIFVRLTIGRRTIYGVNHTCSSAHCGLDDLLVGILLTLNMNLRVQRRSTKPEIRIITRILRLLMNMYARNIGQQFLVNLSFSFLYTYNSCFSTLALAGRPLFLVIGLAFET